VDGTNRFSIGRVNLAMIPLARRLMHGGRLSGKPGCAMLQDRLIREYRLTVDPPRGPLPGKPLIISTGMGQHC